MQEGWRIAAYVLTALGYAFAVLLIPRIILERRQPAATMAWVLAIALLPVVGVPLYYLVGEFRIRRHIRAKIESLGVAESSLEQRIRPADLPDPVAAECALVLSASGAPPPVSGNRVTLIDGGKEAYEAVLGLVQEARDHIHAQFFILDLDPVGKRFIHALASRARSGVRVRLLLDDLGSWRALRGIVKPLKEAGGEVAAFLPALPLHKRWSAHLRNHRKLLIADGAAAFTGGMNIGTNYMAPRPGPATWRDTAIVIRGAAVSDLQSAFLDDWAFATDEAVPAGRLFPSLHLRHGEGASGTVQVVLSGPDREMRPIYRGTFAAFTAARRRIWVSTPYFVPDDAIRMALENAALRGVDVRLLVPERSDTRMVTLAGRSYFEDLMAAGVRVHTYRPGRLHAKTLVIDDAVGVVGSPNVDLRSFFLNFELGVFLYGRREIAALAGSFERLLPDAPEVVPGEFARRPRLARLLENTCRIFSPLL